MPTAPRRVPHACPRCSLQLTVVRTDEGATVEYDVSEWAKVCKHPDAGSPLACPSVRQLLKGWLRNL